MQKGFSLMEVILSVALFALIAVPLVTAILHAQESVAYAGTLQRANFLAEEGIEAVRNIRDNNFSNLADGTYGLALVNNVWTLVGSSDTTDVFTRSITLGSVGANTKTVTSTVNFQYGRARQGSVAVASWFTNWLAAGISWASLSVESSFDLINANSGNNNNDALSLAYANNYLYIGRSNSGGKELYAFDVSNPANPQLVGSRDLDGDPNDMVIRGNYLYIASSDNSQELQIVDISDPTAIDQAGKLTSVDLTNANSGNNNANGVRLGVSVGYLLMIRDGGDKLVIFDLTNPTSPGNPVGREDAVEGTPTDMVVFGNYAYVSSDDNSKEIQIFDHSNKNNPTRVGSVDINSGNNNANALSLFVTPTHLLVGRVEHSAAPELYSFSLTDPTAPSLASTFEVDANVEDIWYDATASVIFYFTSDSNNEVQVIDGTNPASLPSPPALATLNINDSPQQFLYDATLDRLFVASSYNSAELQILKPN